MNYRTVFFFFFAFLEFSVTWVPFFFLSPANLLYVLSPFLTSKQNSGEDLMARGCLLALSFGSDPICDETAKKNVLFCKRNSN